MASGRAFSVRTQQSLTRGCDLACVRAGSANQSDALPGLWADGAAAAHDQCWRMVLTQSAGIASYNRGSGQLLGLAWETLRLRARGLWVRRPWLPFLHLRQQDVSHPECYDVSQPAQGAVRPVGRWLDVTLSLCFSTEGASGCSFMLVNP